MIDIAPPPPPPTPTTSPRCPLRALMAFDFELLRESFEEFIAALEVDEYKQAQEVWHGFAARLSRRLRLEEELLLPAYAEARPVDAQLLRNDDVLLRAKLVQLGARLQLSLLRAEHLRSFVKLMRQHSHRKDALYAWGEVHLSAQARVELLQRLRGPLQGEKPNEGEQGSLPFQVAI